MSEYEFFNRMINKIDKDYGYDIANEFQRLFIKKENENIELQQRIDKVIEIVKLCNTKCSKEVIEILGDKE